MRNLRASFVLGLFALTACGGGQTGGAVPLAAAPSNPGNSGGVASSAGVASNAARAPKPKPKLGFIRFRITVPKRNAVEGKTHGVRPNFIPSHATSIVITLVTVNGGPPPAGLPTVVTSNLSSCSSGCTVSGPNAPVASSPGDAFTLAIFDATNGTGNKIATGAITIAVLPAVPNSGNVTMQGVPHTFVLAGSVPTGAGGTAFGAPAGLAVNVEDIDGQTIAGTYAQPVTVSDSDVLTPITQASGLTVTGSCATPATSVILNNSTDAAALALCYGGLDIVPAVISGTTSLVTTPVTIGTFAPTVQPIVYTGPLNGTSNPEIDLYVANGPSGGTGSFGNWTSTQAGWTNAPYSKSITETDNCATIATFAPTSNGTAWQSNAILTPTVGTCTLNLNGGGAATTPVINTYTTTSVGINLLHHGHHTGKPPHGR